jgi:DNA-binding beta-propeller fold protein YncE
MRTRTSTTKRRARRVECALAAVAVTLATAAPVQAATYVYVASSDKDAVLQYSADSSGALSPLAQPSVAAGQLPSDVAVSPNARWVYVANAEGQTMSEGVAQFDLQRGGLLAAMTPPWVSAQAPLSITVSPDNSSVYALNNAGTVSQYDVGNDGTLSPKNPATITLDLSQPTTPTSIAISPDGGSLYVTNWGFLPGSTNVIYQFDVDVSGGTGTLSPKNPPTVPAAVQPGLLAMSPDGKSVYVPNAGSNTVSHYSADANGALTLERSVGAGDAPAQAVVSPDGESLYVTNSAAQPATTGSVFQYDVGAGGTLSPKDPRKVPSDAGSHPLGVAVSPDGGSVYVTDFGGPRLGAGAVYQFDVDESDGTLSAKDPASLGAGTSPGLLAVSPAFATAQADLLTGTAGDDVICGRGGSDKISGLGGDDRLYGDRCGARASATAAADRAVGRARAGHDLLLGGRGRDRLYGGAGRDRLYGGRGRDLLRGGAGRDWLRGGAGRDRLHVRGGGRDKVHCGGGRDTVIADKRDSVRRCERIIRR